MALDIPEGAPTMLVRRDAFERAGLTREVIDARYNLTPEEFRVEAELIAIGPLHEDEAVGDLTTQLEALGLRYFDDFVELSGNWPAWLRLHAAARRARGPSDASA